MTQTEKQKMMLTAPVEGLICRMAVPTIISMLITALYNMADTYFVGKLGSNAATGAVGVALPLMAIIQATGFFFGHGSGNSISRHLGAGDVEDAEKLAACGFAGAIGAGLIICVLGQLLIEPLARLLGSTATILPYAKEYMRYILFAAPYMTAALVLNNQLRLQGNANFAMIGITSGAVLNVALDPLFIFTFDMGVAGAAAATALSQLVSFVILLWALKRAGCVPLRFRYVCCMPSVMGQIFGGGLPSLVRQGLASLSVMMLNRAAGPYGDAAIAAMSIVGRICQFAGSAVIGFGQGFQPVCGFNYGAGKRERVEKAFWFGVKVASAVLLVTAVVGFVLSDRLIALFRQGDAEVIAIGSFALRCQCVTLPLVGWVIMNNMMFQTCGYTSPASLLAAARQGLFFIPAVMLLPLPLGLLGVQISQSISDLLAFSLAVYIYKKYEPRMWEMYKV